ncbi:hypothetical protein WA026_020086 [Henosepilachna vigintioctopunctata]|uniref:Craniofacial development protein 2-like n=1 Tax=Henosepilachna vigintioctopunctata TaxID=420089 RepID=A0AAW1U215_9CUCU
MNSVTSNGISFSEVRRKGEGLMELRSGHMFYHRGTDTGRTSGTRFIVNRRMKHLMTSYESTSDRISKIEMIISRRYNLMILQVYAPTASYTDDQVEMFYEEVQHLYESSGAYFKLVIGNFNAQIGEKQPGERWSVGVCGGLFSCCGE